MIHISDVVENAINHPEFPRLVYDLWNKHRNQEDLIYFLDDIEQQMLDNIPEERYF